MSTDESDRAAAAFREAMTGDPLADFPAVNPRSVRRRLTRRRRGAVIVATVIALILGAVVLPRLVGPTNLAASPVEPAVPAGWRVEQYRNVTIQVPDTWGYVGEPGTRVCDPPDFPRSYVSLGELMACPHFGDGYTEHVSLSAIDIHEGTPRLLPPVRQVDGWWLLERVIGEGERRVRVDVMSRDRSLADRIADSAQVGYGACPATSEVQRVGSHTGAANLDALRVADDLLICQYDPITDYDDGGLRAARPLTGEPAKDLADALARTLTNGAEAADGCSGLKKPQLELAATVRLISSAEIWVTAGTCIDPADANTTFGGVDGGDTLRQLSSSLCGLIVQPPIRTEPVRGPSPCDR